MSKAQELRKKAGDWTRNDMGFWRGVAAEALLALDEAENENLRLEAENRRLVEHSTLIELET